jgi:hypothetical protein
MSETKGFDVVPHPQRAAEQWFELFRSGKRKEAANQVAELLRDLSIDFADELTKPLIGFTHGERGPWDKIWDGGRGKNERIPYAPHGYWIPPDRAVIRVQSGDIYRHEAFFRSAETGRVEPKDLMILKILFYILPDLDV